MPPNYLSCLQHWTTGNWQAIYVDSANSTWNYRRKDHALWWTNTTHTTIKSKEKLKKYFRAMWTTKTRYMEQKKKEIQGARKRRVLYDLLNAEKNSTNRKCQTSFQSSRLWAQECSSWYQKIDTFGSSLCCVEMAENDAWYDCRGRHWKKKTPLLWNNGRS